MKNQNQTDAKKAIAQQTPHIFLEKDKDASKSIDLEDRIELERREAYIEPKTRDLLRKLLVCADNEEITSVYTPSFGFVYQIPDPTSNENEPDKISRDFLENLAKLDILLKNFDDSVSACPNCESTIITFHNRCPKCKSHNVKKTSLTEHIPCGYIDQKDKYLAGRCPKCGELLVEGQYRNMGRWYVCNECSERFEHPEFDLICHNCNKHFTINEAHVLEIPKFSLNPVRKKEIRQNVASLEDIRILLAELGFTIEIPGLALGQKSGMHHHFSLIAKKQISEQEIVIALDHAVSESEVQSSPLILYIYKTSEVKVDIPMFVAIPALSETARKIAQGHNILLIEGSTEEAETMNKIKNEIEERMNQINQKIVEETKAKQIEKKPESTSFFSKLIGTKRKTDQNEQSKPITDNPT
jgi:predicted RNA-binding Zn-ribbon protein involved in translation (DUF1610 family)